MPPSERRNGSRRLPAPWNADACCWGANQTERFGEVQSDRDAALWIWLEGTTGDTLALWELLVRAIMATARDVPLERLPGRRPPWLERFVDTFWVITVGEHDGEAHASCVCIFDPAVDEDDSECEGASETVSADRPRARQAVLRPASWAWHAVGSWSLAWPSVRLLADALTALGARVTADIEASVDFASTGPVVSSVSDATVGAHRSHSAREGSETARPSGVAPHQLLRAPLVTPKRTAVPVALTSCVLSPTPATVHAGRQLMHACAGDEGEGGASESVALYVGQTPAVVCPVDVVVLLQRMGAMMAMGRVIRVDAPC